MHQNNIQFKQYLLTAFDNGNFATDDILAFLLPLFEEVLGFHADNLVAPFEKETTLFITENRLDIDETHAHKALYNLSSIKVLFKDYQSKGFVVTGETKIETDISESYNNQETNLNIQLNAHAAITNPVYVKGYTCYEQQLKHHDELTDIFCLGLILGSIAFGLDLYDEDDLKTFVECRTNPVYYNNRIHPTISTLITEMTELDRNKRCKDLYDIINRLTHYRDFNPEKQLDLSNTKGWVNKEISSRSQFILNKLRNRLFDTSKRNRLLYYKSNARFINLTVSSVPLVLHYQSINPANLFFWNDDIANKIKGCKEIALNKYLRFEDHEYISSQLDRIKAEAQKDKNEYGFSQLKLVVAFLNWHNLKEDLHERIQSPLLLIPVEINKKKALKEAHYTLQILDNAAEVNPVVANHLKDLYGIKLPDFINFDDTTLPEFFDNLKLQIDAANQGIKLSYLDKPRIKLIHSVAKQTANTFRRRLKRGERLTESYKNLAYSYTPENYKPLGLEIFKNRIEQKPSYLEFLVNDNIKLGVNNLTGTEVNETIKERKLFELQDSENNPYSWDVDVCNMVVGNFNYKKMSLVSDYNFVADEKIEHQVFEQFFSDKPKSISTKNYNLNEAKEWYHVVMADPTQTKAILQARDNESYIIQGPPGTGKSQTITNLIADFIANGKNVLFVCEKRAALDVVYYRLKQQQLHELCCYIHDSQNDKREFIKNLKETYEDFTKHKLDYNAITINRNNAINTIETQLKSLQLFHSINLNVNHDAGINIRNLIDTLVELKPHIKSLSSLEQEAVPNYNNWLQFGETLQQLSKALEESGAEPEFANHTFSKINESIFNDQQPITTLQKNLQEAQKQLLVLSKAIEQNNIPTDVANSLQQVKELIQDSVLLEPLAVNKNIDIILPNTSKTKGFEKEVKGYKTALKQLEKQQKENENWNNKFSYQDTQVAFATAKKLETSFFKFLNGSWRRLKSQMSSSYHFNNHQVKPMFTDVLQKLLNEHEQNISIENIKEKFATDYGIENIDLTYLGIEKIRGKLDDKEINFLLNHPQANELVLQLYKLQTTLFDTEKSLGNSISNFNTKQLQELKDDIEEILINIDYLQELLPALKSFASLPNDVKHFVKSIATTPKQTQAAMANKTWNNLLQNEKEFSTIDGNSIEQIVKQIHTSYKKLLQVNAQLIRANIRKKFAGNIELSMMSVSQLNNEQKDFKKKYNEGRKILENEFSKSMRYKSIRELSAKESGLVLKDIKPIWLMSPLSVSDSLPIDTNYFDVVIFDEASQITLEEGIPALYRAKQSIIVGDEMQMPPTNFFTAKAQDPDDLESFNNISEEEILSADADSLLTQGARKLNSVMLGWHYRSRYETLISYSNHAFYNKNLLTIPDRTIHHNSKVDIVINKPEDAIEHVENVLNRSISFHYLENSLYEKRTNQDEAYYIANVVRELLKKESGNSIGIVAFSQEQQMQIEEALTSLALTDKAFEALLEKEYNRIEDDQFVGLIVKNLENIQGDERDIIIMSVCYGFDSRKKMLMNFGPINKKGGEKRLNVIFSRSKKHMVIVSSIKHHNITNEYNEGANYFKRFLHYAEMISTGNMETANTILSGLVTNNNSLNTVTNHSSILLKQIKISLEQKGLLVDFNVGQSSFKCSLAIKQKQDDVEYSLGVIIDDEQHYNNENWLEQYFQRPAILQSFGWKVIAVFAKDWLQQPVKVIDRIIAKLNAVEVIEKVVESNDFLIHENVEEEDNNIKETGLLFIEQESSKSSINDFSHLQFTKLIFRDASSNKFWQVAIDDLKLIIQYGRVGAKGQTNIKSFATKELAEKEMQKMIIEKETKGYKIL